MVETMNIYVYANENADFDLQNPAKEALETATVQTINHFANNGESIGRNVQKDPNLPNIDISSSDSLTDVLVRFGDWRERYEGGQRTGVHLLLSRKIGGGEAIARFGGAWRNPPMAIATVLNSQPEQYFKSLCIHEAYHNFINIGNRLTASTAGQPGLDHELGYVDPDTGEQTPMLNGYWGEGPDVQGNCSNTVEEEPPHSLELSPCALNKTLESYRNQGNVL